MRPPTPPTSYPSSAGLIGNVCEEFCFFQHHVLYTRTLPEVPPLDQRSQQLTLVFSLGPFGPNNDSENTTQQLHAHLFLQTSTAVFGCFLPMRWRLLAAKQPTLVPTFGHGAGVTMALIGITQLSIKYHIAHQAM